MMEIKFDGIEKYSIENAPKDSPGYIAYQKAVKFAAKKLADHVIREEEKFIVEKYGLDPDKVHEIYRIMGEGND